MTEEQGLLRQNHEVPAEPGWREEVWEKFEFEFNGRCIEGVRSLQARIDLELMLNGEVFLGFNGNQVRIYDNLRVYAD